MATNLTEQQRAAIGEAARVLGDIQTRLAMLGTSMIDARVPEEYRRGLAAIEAALMRRKRALRKAAEAK